jgi:hypothetical protein
MNRTVGLAAGLVLVFITTVTILVTVMPGPLKPTDYLVFGAVATFLCLLLLFVVLMKTVQRPDASKRDKPE